MDSLSSLTCGFCRRTPTEVYGLTACAGDRDEVASWRRHEEPLCVRCHRILTDAGQRGRVFKKTGVRWWLGQGAELFRATPVA